jgi:hypothetical protein
MPKPTTLVETVTVTAEAAAAAKDTGRMTVQLISPGWGSSGYYSADVLAEAATNVVIPAGTHMYADHPTPTEAKERPVRSIKDLMSVTVEDARVATQADIDEWGADAGALVTDVQVSPLYQPLVEQFKGAIGVSIRGAGNTAAGTAEGKNGTIIESLEFCTSVDWVTRAGRGGRVLSLAECAQANERAIGHGISEATVNDTREALQTVLRDAYGGDKTWVWVRDFDDATVWFEIEAEGDESGIYGQTYTDTDGAVALSGDRTEVRVKTTYVPATRPDSNTPTTEESEEDTMGKISIEESEHTTLTEKAGRVDALQEENVNLKAENTALKEAESGRVRGDRARTLVAERATEAGVTFSEREVKGFLADITLTEAGELDEAKFSTLVDEDAAAKKAATGSGTVIGHGGTTVTESKDFWTEIDEHLDLPKGA